MAQALPSSYPAFSQSQLYDNRYREQKYDQNWENLGYPKELFITTTPDFKELSADGYTCSYEECKQILRNPLKLKCNHKYCQPCLQRIANKAGPQMCQPCLVETQAFREKYTKIRKDGFTDLLYIDLESAVEDIETRKEVNKLKVRCPWGCMRKGSRRELPIRYLEDHMKECESRKLTCLWCRDEVRFNETSKHATECLQREVRCPFSCGTSQILTARSLPEHLHTCKSRPYLCKICNTELKGAIYDHLLNDCVAHCPYGCKNIPKDKVILHLNDKKYALVHLLNIMQDIAELKKMVMRCRDDSSTVSIDDITRLSQRIFEANDSMNEATRIVDATAFSISSESGKQTLQEAAKDGIEEKEKLISETSKLMEEVTSEQSKFTEIRESFDEEKEKLTEYEEICEQEMNYHEGILQTSEGEMNKIQQHVDMMTECAFKGRLIWRLDNIKSLGGEMRYSPSFYTAPHGYKMCLGLRYQVDSQEKTTFLSLSFVVMKGEYDSLLDWPFTHMVRISLRSQKSSINDICVVVTPDNSEIFQQPTDDMNKAFTFPKLATEQAIAANESNGFVVDDIMFVEAQVQI